MRGHRWPEEAFPGCVLPAPDIPASAMHAPRTRGNTLRKTSAAVGLAAAMGTVAGCSGGGEATKHTVVYEFLGRGPADVRYVVDEPDSDGEEAKGVASGWTKSIEVTTPGTLMHMTVYTSPSEAPDETVT